MKRLFAFILCLVIVISLVGCGESGKNPVIEEMKIGTIKGPTGVGMLWLMDKSDSGESAGKYSFSVYSAPDELVGKVVKGDLDVACISTNLAANLYKKTNKGIKILAVNTYGVLSILENGNSISSVADLKGKTVYGVGEGANPEYVFKHILTENGLDPEKDVDLHFVATNDELAAAIIGGTADIALAPEPIATTVTVKKPTVRKALDLTTEWEKVSPESALMMGCIIVRTEYLDAYPDTVENFLVEYKASVDAVFDLDTTATLAEKYEIIPSAAIAKKAIGGCHVAYLDGAIMKEKLEGYLSVLYNYNPTSVGGELPDENFWYLP